MRAGRVLGLRPSAAASTTIGAPPAAPITRRRRPRSGSWSTAPIASANSPALAHLVVAEAGARREARDVDRGQDFGLIEHGRQRTRREVGDGDAARAGGAAD